MHKRDVSCNVMKLSTWNLVVKVGTERRIPASHHYTKYHIENQQGSCELLYWLATQKSKAVADGF